MPAARRTGPPGVVDAGQRAEPEPRHAVEGTAVRHAARVLEDADDEVARLLG